MRGMVLFLLFCLPCMAGDAESVKRSCRDRTTFNGPGFHWLEECIENIVTFRPVHPAILSIAPGTGLGLGLGYSDIKRGGRAEFLPSATYVHSTDGSNLIEGGIIFALPPVSLVVVDEANTGVVTDYFPGFHDTRSRARPEDLTFANAVAVKEPEPVAGEVVARTLHGSGRVALVRDYWQIDSKLSVAVNAQWAGLTQQAFYGLGALSSRAGEAFYGLHQTSFKFAINDPITTWSEAGFEAEYLRPRVRSVNGASRPSIELVYSDATAPGLKSVSDFVRYGPYIRFRLPIKKRLFRLTNLKLGYDFYHDVQDTQLSFRRLRASVRSEYDLRLPNKNTASHRSALANFLCPVGRGAVYCTAGTFALGAEVAAAYTGQNNRVPFYFGETLGGADIYGNDTLRGFVDYRFRGPSRMLYQAEYRHRVWGPLGAFTFADSGRVAEIPSDLAFEHMRHDYGIGLYVSATNRIVFRAYMGFGTGEGIRPNAKPSLSF